MARGIPYAFHQRGRKNMRPPVQRDTHVYRDMSAEEEIVEEAPVPREAPAAPPERAPRLSITQIVKLKQWFRSKRQRTFSEFL